MATETKTISAPSSESEWVKGLGLTSATTLVMGSMIGSGIFIVSAEIARLVDSPALLIAAWIVTGFMTITGALAYGELAAMMPRAGGQYVYLRESLGPLWGFLYGWTLFLVIQTGTIAAVGVAFGKFLGVFFPSVSSTHWIWHIAHVPPIPIGPMVSGQHGCRSEHAESDGCPDGDLSVGAEYLRRKDRARQCRMSLLSPRPRRCLAWCCWGFSSGATRRRSPPTLAQTSGATRDGMPCIRCRSESAGPSRWWERLTIIAVAQVGSLFSSDAWNNVTFTAAEVK